MTVESYQDLLSLDLPPLLTALFASLTCALLGNFLVLKKTSLLGDSLAHSVLPGIVVAFLLTGSRATWAVLPGAVIAALCATAAIQFLVSVARIESSAAMGVIFSSFFAAGVVLMEQAAARSVDLDADCLLFGQLESIFVLPEGGAFSFAQLFWQLPKELWLSAVIFLVTAVAVFALRKELTLAAFDPQLSTALGFRTRMLDLFLYTLVSCAIVASFQVVGSILVIGMLIIPAAAARMLTDRLHAQFALSLLVAALSVFFGYVAGTRAPELVGTTNALSAAGMIIVIAGLILTLAIIISPSHGTLAKAIRNLRLQINIQREDLLAELFRKEEGIQIDLPVAKSFLSRLGIFAAALRGEIAQVPKARRLFSAPPVKIDTLILTPTGRTKARTLVRSHRLWENYLVERAGVRADHVHETAERLEHVAPVDFSAALATRLGEPNADPHGRTIPSSEEDAQVERDKSRR